MFDTGVFTASLSHRCDTMPGEIAGVSFPSPFSLECLGWTRCSFGGPCVDRMPQALSRRVRAPDIMTLDRHLAPPLHTFSPQQSAKYNCPRRYSLWYGMYQCGKIRARFPSVTGREMDTPIPQAYARQAPESGQCDNRLPGVEPLNRPTSPSNAYRWQSDHSRTLGHWPTSTPAIGGISPAAVLAAHNGQKASKLNRLQIPGVLQNEFWWPTVP